MAPMESPTVNGKEGFTYLSVLFMITVMGLAAGAAGKYWSVEAQRDKEDELIFRGREIRAAIGRYYFESPGANSYPRSLEDLVKDPRYPVAKRYLRRVYPDPMTGEASWEIIKAPDGGIMGLRSASEAEPIKKKGFPFELKGFEDRHSYGEWLFVFVPQEVIKKN